MRIAYAILKRMKAGGIQRGFTIVETLIVLAVTGALFLIAATAVSGRQARSEFEQSINDVRSQIQQIINEVATGFYPNAANFTCTAGASGPVLAAGSTAQGENTDCIFLGKVIQFDLDGSDPEQMVVHSVAALRETTAGNEVTTLAEADPVVVTPVNSSPAGFPNASETRKLLYGLKTHEVFYGAVKTNIGAIGFLSSLAKYNGSTIVSGSQQVDLYPMNGTSTGSTLRDAAEDINANFLTSPQNPSNGAKICFVNDGTNQSGLITIGTGNRQTTVTLSIRNNTTCS